MRQELDWLKNYLVGAERGTSSTRSDVCLESLLGNYGFLIGRYFVQEAFSGTFRFSCFLVSFDGELI